MIETLTKEQAERALAKVSRAFDGNYHSRRADEVARDIQESARVVADNLFAMSAN